VKADAILNQLLRLRRLSERRALETLLTCDGERRRAEQAAEEAAGEAARHLAQAKAYERKHIESFAGQPVSENAIRRFRESLDALMEEQQRLRAVGEAKQQTLRERLDALEEARASFRMRQNAVNKLDHLVTQQAALTSLQQAGLAEAADEEQSCGRPVPPASGN
jgi:plasmid maintenance system killer protein